MRARSAHDAHAVRTLGGLAPSCRCRPTPGDVTIPLAEHWFSDRSCLVQSNSRNCVRSFWFCGCAIENFPWLFVHIRFSSRLPSARELHVICGFFYLECVGFARQWVAIRHRVRSELLHQDRQFSGATPVCGSQCSRVLHVLLPRHSQHGGMVRLSGNAEWMPPRLFKQANGPGSSGDEYGILEDDRWVDKGVFQQRYF